MPSRKKPLASPVRQATNAQTATPSRPDRAGWTASPRVSRQPATRSADATAATIDATRLPATAWATTNTTTGTPEATIPDIPPIWSRSVGLRGAGASTASGSGSGSSATSSRTTGVPRASVSGSSRRGAPDSPPRPRTGPVGGSIGSAGSDSEERVSGRMAVSRRTADGPGGASRTGRRPVGPRYSVRPLELVVRVVDDLPSVTDGHPPAGAHGTTRLDARDPPASQPHEGDAVGAVEELGLERRHRAARTESPPSAGGP